MGIRSNGSAIILFKEMFSILLTAKGVKEKLPFWIINLSVDFSFENSTLAYGRAIFQVTKKTFK